MEDYYIRCGPRQKVGDALDPLEVDDCLQSHQHRRMAVKPGGHSLWAGQVEEVGILQAEVKKHVFHRNHER